MRRLVGWLLICCFLAWGPGDMLALALAARLPRNPAANSIKAACVCRMCAATRNANRKPCCCAKSHTPAEALVMQAQCDEQPTVALAVKAKLPLLLPALFAPPPAVVVGAFPHVFPYAPSLRVLTPEPPVPPPYHT